MISAFHVENPSTVVSLTAPRISPLACFSVMHLHRCSLSPFLFFGVSLISYTGSPDMVVNLLSDT